MYLAEIVIWTFAQTVPNTNNWMENLLWQMLSVALPLLPDITAFSDKCDIADDLFGMLIRYLLYYRQAVFSETVFETIVRTAVAGVGVNNYETGKTLYTFL